MLSLLLSLFLPAENYQATRNYGKEVVLFVMLD
jgi:hypothetical protein